MHLYINGVRLNLRGESIVDHGMRIGNIDYPDVFDPQLESYYNYFTTLDSMEMLVNELLKMNYNCVRPHMGPAPVAFYDLCDEKGLIISAETNIYGSGMRDKYPEDANEPGTDGKSLMDNSKQWIREYVQQLKNHPSICIWSASNEAQPGRIIWDLKELEQAFLDNDNTRPVVHHRDNQTRFAKVYHYTHGYGYEDREVDLPKVPQNLYEPFTDKWTDKIQIDKSKIAGEGEFFFTYLWSRFNPGYPTDTWRKKIIGQGLLTRAFRYTDYAYILPYRMNWAWVWSRKPGWDMHKERDFVKKSMAAVAVFDKEYDDLYDDLLNLPSPPVVQAGSKLKRTLLIYNDEFSGKEVEVIWKALVNNEVIDSGSFKEIIDLGYHTEKEIEISIPPDKSGKEMVLVLESRKNSKQKYFDDSSYIFHLLNN